MGREPAATKNVQDFEKVKNDFLQWTPLFQRLGMNPHRYYRDEQAIYFSTI